MYRPRAHAHYRHINAVGLLLSALVPTFGPTAQAEHLYYVSSDSIVRIDLENGGEQVIRSGLVSPDGLGIDPVQGKIYWGQTDASFERIKRCDVDGTDVQNFEAGFDPVLDIAIDSRARRLYWSAGDRVRRVNLDGSGSQTIYQPVFGRIHGLTIDESENKVYWIYNDCSPACESGTYFLLRSDLDGSNRETILGTLSILKDVAIDNASQKVYLTSPSDDAILIADLASPTPTPLLSTPAPTLIILDVQAGAFFWASLESPITRANLDGSGVQTFANTQGARGLAIHRVADCNDNGIDDWCDTYCGQPGNYCDVPGCGTGDECNENGVLDACDVSSGTSEDCNFNVVPDECELNTDCNANSIKDICDIGAGTSQDTNGDSIPDECCPPPCAPDPLLPNPFGTCTVGNANCVMGGPACASGTCDTCGQVRYISFGIPGSAAGANTAIRVRLTSLYDVAAPLPVGVNPGPALAAFEGEYRYLNTIAGTLSRCCNSASNPTACASSAVAQACNSDADCTVAPHTTCMKNLCPDSPSFNTFFRCARLGCTPEYRDWGSDFAGLITYATGDAVVPDSTYHAAMLAAGCAGNEAACLAASVELMIKTERWGNVDCTTAIVPGASDLGFVVSKSKDALGALIKPRTQLREAIPNSLLLVGAQDVGRLVDVVKGLHYPASWPISQCP